MSAPSYQPPTDGTTINGNGKAPQHNDEDRHRYVTEDHPRQQRIDGKQSMSGARAGAVGISGEGGLIVSALSREIRIRR